MSATSASAMGETIAEQASRIASLEEQFSAAETSAIMWKARCEQAERQLAEARRALHLADQWLCWFLEGDEFDKTYLEEDRAMILAALAPAEKPGSNEEDIR